MIASVKIPAENSEGFLSFKLGKMFFRTHNDIFFCGAYIPSKIELKIFYQKQAIFEIFKKQS